MNRTDRVGLIAGVDDATELVVGAAIVTGIAAYTAYVVAQNSDISLANTLAAIRAHNQANAVGSFCPISANATKSTQSRPTNAPPGTIPIDQSGYPSDDIHAIKKGVGAGAKDWTGIAPNGDVITTNPDGSANNNGPADSYVPGGTDDDGDD